MTTNTRPLSPLLAAALALTLGAAATTRADEFVGPLPGWKNLRTDYGAVGDGAADDTAAIQQALDDLRHPREGLHCVLYIPAGVYRITDTVRTMREAHHESMGITVVGEDPATTVLRWDGADGGLMVNFNAWYARISRLTLDGAGRAGAALGYGPRFSTYNETSDMVFQDVAVGMMMGVGPHGQAENAVLRCTFRRCSDAGIRTTNYNSLDIWVWHSLFEDCGYGLFNGAGNFHVYESLFLRSAKMDIGTANLMAFSFVNNTSIGSHSFLDWASGHTWGAPTSITGNRIIEPTGEWALRLGNGGPYLVMDNVIRARPDAEGPVAGMTWGDQAFIGNVYSVSNAVREAGRFLRIAERVVPAAELDGTPPALPPTPPRRERRVFSVPAGADAAAMQAAIGEAAALAGQRPVVHLPKGDYRIGDTLVVPAGCDVQIVGDGAAETATVLHWTGAAGQPLLRLEGPSRAAVRNLAIQAGAGIGLLVEDADQPEARIFTNQLMVGGGNPSQKGRVGLLVDGLDHADVQLRCLQGGTFMETWVRVVGGPARRAGRTTGGQVTILTGATGTADRQYAVEQGGRLLVRAVYHEVSGEGDQAILLDGTGALAVDATRFSYKTSAERPLIRAHDFRGDFTLLTGLLLPVDSTHTARVEIGGDGRDARVLCLGNIFWVNEPGVDADKVWRHDADPPARAGLLLCNMNGSPPNLEKGFDRLAHRGDEDEAFLLDMVRMIREGRIGPPPPPAPVGVTDVRLHRVNVGTSRDGIGVWLRAAGGGSTGP